MKSNTFGKLTSLAVAIASACVLFSAPSAAIANETLSEVVGVVKPVSDYFPSFPWIGLILDEVSYGPINVSDVRINNGDKLAFVKPGETLNGSLRYHVDSANQHLFHRYHLVVGIKGIGAQDCVAHTYGIWDSKGKGTFTLQAPLEPGVYEVRFFYQEASTCEEARNIWDETTGDPSSYATIGVIVVE